MKKILGLATAICCMFALCVSLAGCGVDKSGFTGNWSLESGTDATLDADSIALMKTLGLQTILSLNEDDTGSLNLFGETLDASWKATSATEGSITIDGKDCTMVLSDDKLTVNESDGKYLSFVKYDGVVPTANSSSSASSSIASSASATADDESGSDADADATETADAADATDETETAEGEEQAYTDEGTDSSYDDSAVDGAEDGADDADVYYGNEGQ